MCVFISHPNEFRDIVSAPQFQRIAKHCVQLVPHLFEQRVGVPRNPACGRALYALELCLDDGFPLRAEALTKGPSPMRVCSRPLPTRPRL